MSIMKEIQLKEIFDQCAGMIDAKNYLGHGRYVSKHEDFTYENKSKTFQLKRNLTAFNQGKSKDVAARDFYTYEMEDADNRLKFILKATVGKGLEMKIFKDDKKVFTNEENLNMVSRIFQKRAAELAQDRSASL